MHGQKPLVQRNVTALKESADSDAELLATRFALVKSIPNLVGLREFNCFVDDATVRTHGAIGPAEFFEILAGLGFVCEDRVIESGFHVLLSFRQNQTTQRKWVCQVHNRLKYA